MGENVIYEKRIKFEREHRKSEALRAAGECVEHLRVLEIISSPEEDNSKIERTHEAAQNLAKVIREEL